MELSTITAEPVEILTARQWATILGISPREVRKVGRSLARTELKPVWRERVNVLMVEQSVASCHDLFAALTRSEPQWQPRVKKIELREDSQKRAEKIRAVMVTYFSALALGRTSGQAEMEAIQQWFAQFGKPCSDRNIRNWAARVEERGGIDLAPMEAFVDGRNGSRKHRKGSELPPDFVRDAQAKFLDSTKGVRSAFNILAEYEAMWQAGASVPGFGIREADVRFPVTRSQIEKLAPGRDSRESSGRGKFFAKANGYTAAMPFDWSEVEPVRRVLFDDKVLDIEVMTDDGRKVFRPHIYIAYCGGTRRVLAFIAREENRMTQFDVEGLQAAVLRDHGFGGPEAGWVTHWIKERGTVSISPARKAYLEALFPGRLVVDQTMMIGGKSAPGDYVQKGSGNFFGKAVLESFMASLDHFAKTMPAATGNNYSRQPAILGDTTLTLEKIINSARQGHRPARSLLEEGILTAAMARIIGFLETGEYLPAVEAARRTGIRPPVLFFSDFLGLLGELFAAFNNRRGHRMQGFAKVRIPHPNQEGVFELVAESPNDKARRMLDTMSLQGRSLARPHDADIAAMLHKVKRVTVTANGVVTEGLTYWHEHSSVCRAAAAIQGGEKTYLALYNPVAPAVLYILGNPTSHLAPVLTEIPDDFRPQLLEVLPLYKAPSPVDREEMRRNAERVATYNSRHSREIALRAEPLLLARAEERQQLADRLEPVRAAIRSAAPGVAPTALDPSRLAGELLAAEEATRETRAQAQPDAAMKLAEFMNED